MITDYNSDDKNVLPAIHGLRIGASLEEIEARLGRD